MALPNFLLIGVGKAGTTSVYHYARQHPQAAVSRIREPKYLMYEGHLELPIRGKTPPFRIKTVQAYEDLYAGYETRPARMDISPSYLVFAEQTIIGIRKRTPDAKMIVIYRQPADRGYSNYLMHVRMGDERLGSYARALQAEKDGIPREYGQIRTYFNRGLYAERTRRFLQEFSREHFLFLLYDDLTRDPAKFLETIFRFMDIDPDFRPDITVRHNAGAWPRSLWLHRLSTSANPLKKKALGILPLGMRKSLEQRIRSTNLAAPPRLDPELRRALTLAYREDILRLQDLIGRDLSAWTAEA